MKGSCSVKNTKENILNASLKLFLQKSFKEVTLKEIVKESGISKGAFYHYFNSKEQLFREVVNNVFYSVMDIPYDQFSNESLYHFYIDYINYYVESLKGKNIIEESKVLSFNYISLIFDAIKIFPDFKERLKEVKEVQLNSWKSIIHAAREKGEIDSLMSDEEIANMFINSSSGVEMHSIFREDSQGIGKTLLSLWDSFYQELKS
jgi:AcrR family transcriptional regulator